MKLFTVNADMSTSEGVNSKLVHVPFGDGMMKLLTGVEGGVCVKTADLVQLKDDSFRIVREGRDRDRRALVYVACPAGAQMRLFANTVVETIENGAVVRLPRPLEEAAGIGVLHQDEAGALVALIPRASFRLAYEGRRPQGVPPQAVVLWSGRYDANRPCAGLSAFARNNRL